MLAFVGIFNTGNNTTNTIILLPRSTEVSLLQCSYYQVIIIVIQKDLQLLCLRFQHVVGDADGNELMTQKNPGSKRDLQKSEATDGRPRIQRSQNEATAASVFKTPPPTPKSVHQCHPIIERPLLSIGVACKSAQYIVCTTPLGSRCTEPNFDLVRHT